MATRASSLGHRWWLGFRRDALTVLALIPIYALVVWSADWLSGLDEQAQGGVLVALGFTLTVFFHDSALALPPGRLTALLTVPIPLPRIARLILLHLFLIRATVLGLLLVWVVAIGDRWELGSSTGAILLGFGLTWLPFSCIDSLESRFPMQARSPAIALGTVYATGLVALLAGPSAFLLMTTQPSPGAVYGVTAGGVALLALFAYRVPPALRLTFPRSREDRARVRAACWQLVPRPSWLQKWLTAGLEEQTTRLLANPETRAYVRQGPAEPATDARHLPREAGR